MTRKEKFKDCFIEISRGSKKVQKSDYLKEGIIPIISQDKNFISGYTNDYNYLFQGSIPCIVFGDHNKSFKYIDFPFAIGADGVKVFTVKDFLNLKYGYYYLKTIIFPNLGYSRYYKILKKESIPILDNKLQKNLVHKCDIIQTLINKRQRTIEVLDEYLKSVFLDMFGDPILNPKQLDIKTLDYFGSWHTGGTPPKNKGYYNGSIPWFISGELNSFYVKNSKKHVTIEAIKETSTKLVHEGSLLIGMYDTAALKTSITEVKCTCNQAIAFSKINENLGNSIFLMFCIRIGKEFYLSKRKGARQKNLTIKLIKGFEVINPPIELQNKFQILFKIIQIQIENLRKSKELLEELLQSLLYETFNPNQVEERKDEVDLLMSEDIELEQFLNRFNIGDFESIGQYDIEVKKLYKILNRTPEIDLNKLHSKDKKDRIGIIQTKDGKLITIQAKKDYINNYIDETTKD